MILADNVPQHILPMLAKAYRLQRLHHAYIVVGEEGSVLPNMATSICQALLCSQPMDETMAACNTCTPCQTFMRNNHPDVLLIGAKDNPSISMETIRQLLRRLNYYPKEATHQLVTIHQAHQMSHACQHALLKTLEEPPSPVIFFLCTTNIAALLPTIRSRCAVIYLPRSPWAGRLQQLMLQPEAKNIQQTLQGYKPVSGANMLKLAAALAAYKDHAILVRQCLEIFLRDLLLKATLQQDVVHIPAPHICRAIDVLQRLRQHDFLHLNLTSSLEAVLLALTPCEG